MNQNIQISPAQPDSGVRQVSIVGCKGVDTLMSLAGPDEETRPEPGAFRAVYRADRAFTEELEWASLWARYSRGESFDLDFSHNIASNTITLFMDGVVVGSLTAPTRDAVYVRARGHVRWIWSLLLGSAQ